jgi:HEAT repeat protein
VPETPLEEAIIRLQRSYLEYMACLKSVLDFGESNIDALIAGLDHKHANPIAKALGLMMYAPASEKAIPTLLKWLVTQSPMYPDVLEALLRAGDKPSPQVLVMIQEYAENDDDEAVRHLFDLAVRFSGVFRAKVADVAGKLLGHANPHIRESAADAFWRLGLPYGLPFRARLLVISGSDQNENVRKAATEALVKLGWGQ